MGSCIGVRAAAAHPLKAHTPAKNRAGFMGLPGNYH